MTTTRILASLAGAVLIPAILAAQVAPPPAPLSTFGYDRSAPLELTDSLLRVEDGIAIHAISFASPRGGRATGLLFVPAGPGPFAGVIVQHGAPGRVDSTLIELLHRSVMPNAMAVARAGAVAVALDAPWARRLVPPVTFTEADSGYQVQLIVDLQRAVDLLLARPDVDPKRLGYVGRSYGGATGALLAGVERRLKTYVLQVGDGGLVSHFTGADGKGGPPPGIPTARWTRWLAAMSPIEPIRFVHRAPPASILLQSGRTDQAVPPDLAARLHEAAGSPRKVVWYDAGHGLNDAALTDMLAWLHQEIGTRAPPPAAAPRFIPQSALVAMIEVHKASLLRYIDAAPDSMLGFRPTPGVRTFAEQIEHAAVADAFIAHSAITGNDKVPAFGAADKSYLRSKAALKAYSIAAMDYAAKMIGAVSDAAMTEEITQFGTRLPRHRALMEVLDHFPWTLGQTVPYLRMNGVTPPTYTPF